MRIAIAGPTDIARVCNALGMEEEEYYSKVREIAEHIAQTEHEIVIIPDKKSAAEFFAEAYAEEDGKKVIGIIPEDDTEFGTSWLNKQVCDETINCGKWMNAPETLLKNVDILLVLGYGTGSLIEICYTKWFKVKEIYVIEELITEKLPKELNYLDIEYISSDEIMETLK